MLIAETRHLERWWSFIVAIEICSSGKSFKITIFFFGSNLQLSLKCTSFTGRTFPSNHKTPIIHEEHLIFRVNNNQKRRNFPQIIVEQYFGIVNHLAFPRAYSCLPLTPVQTDQPGFIVQKMKFCPVFKYTGTSRQMSRRPTLPDLPCMTFILSTSNKFLDQNSVHYHL